MMAQVENTTLQSLMIVRVLQRRSCRPGDQGQEPLKQARPHSRQTGTSKL